MAQCKSGKSHLCVGDISHNAFNGLCSNCADERDRAKHKKSELTNEDWREGLKQIESSYNFDEHETI